VVVTELFKTGDQVPFMPFVDMVGKGAKESPEHIGTTGSNVGVILVFTVIVTLAEQVWLRASVPVTV
jgi:hypothetical protein